MDDQTLHVLLEDTAPLGPRISMQPNEVDEPTIRAIASFEQERRHSKREDIKHVRVLRRQNITIGISIMSGGIGNTELSANDTTASQGVAWR